MLQRRAGLVVLAGLIASRILTTQSPPPPALSVTGAWTGALVLKSGGETHDEPIYVVLKQEGNALTGTAGPNVDRQFRIRNGRAATETDKNTTSVAFEWIVDGVHVAVELKLIDGTLKGTAAIEGEDGQRERAGVELKRATAPFSPGPL